MARPRSATKRRGMGSVLRRPKGRGRGWGINRKRPFTAINTGFARLLREAGR